MTTNIFTVQSRYDDVELSDKINIDELYEKKQQHDINQLKIFTKLLNRIHNKIKIISRQKIDDRLCWFLVPEFLAGVTGYDQAACIAYIIDKLQQNGFAVRYVHPNALLISWAHWIPSYVRNEFKKKTGITINEFGFLVDKEEKEKDSNNLNESDYGYGLSGKDINQQMNKSDKNKHKKEYTPINTYKPSGNLIYDNDLLDSISSRIDSNK
jgi:hypothetical protein